MSVTTSTLGALGPDDKKEFERVLEVGKRQLQEIEDIKGSLADLVKNTAEKFEIKPKMLSRAIRVAFKNKLADDKAEMDTVEDILSITGNA